MRRGFAKAAGSVPTRRTFIDRLKLEVRGGRGGNGSNSRQPLGPRKRRFLGGAPDGGNGGDGGNVVFRASSSKTSLYMDAFMIDAQDGVHGGSRNTNGRKGKHKIVHVPCGTVVKYAVVPKRRSQVKTDAQSFAEFLDIDAIDPTASIPDEEYVPLSDDEEELERVFGSGRFAADQMAQFGMQSIDLIHQNDSVTVALGGKGGLGSKSNRALPKKDRVHAGRGQRGEHVHVELELKTIADVGLIGFPNAGKSTLLSVVSRTSPKVAMYAFTTLQPNLGAVNLGYDRFSIADLPGLIEDAYRGRGLGHEFLRHAERTRVLLYVLNGEPAEDGMTLQQQFEKLHREVKMYAGMYAPGMEEKPAVVFINKSDVDAHNTYLAFEALRMSCPYPVFLGSAYSNHNLLPMLEAVYNLIPKEESSDEESEESLDREQVQQEYFQDMHDAGIKIR